MTTSVHSALTGSDLHESKGVATALAGEVYVTDGAGSGVWTPAANVILNTSFTTGDTKLTYKTTADTGWIMPVTGGTIGDGSSSASIRANTDCLALFTLFWNLAFTVPGGRGATAAADWAAHKQITLAPITQCAIGIAGSGGSLSTRTLGTTTGAETHTLTAAEIPTITSGGSASWNVLGTSNAGLSIMTANSQNSSFSASSGSQVWFAQAQGATVLVQSLVAAGSLSSSSTNTSGSAHSIMNPTAYLNIMIKL